MALTLNTDASTPMNTQDHFLRTVNTRIAGGGRLTATSAPPIVVVDTREFRSSLPSLLHGRSMRVIPCQLTVADYVLSPTICIERKSIRDLISSFKSGRLFNQVETMFQHYTHPMLLIEFDQNKSFTFEGFSEVNAPTTAFSQGADLQSKIVLLTLAFPKLKIIWSSSPYQTAEIFEELKKNHDEPDPIAAVQVGLQEGEEPGEVNEDQDNIDMLRRIPGVNGKNIVRIVYGVEDLRTLSNMSEADLDPIVGMEVGRQIFRFFNRNVFDD